MCMRKTVEYIEPEITGTYPFPDVKLIYTDVIEENLALKREMAEVKTKLGEIEKGMSKEGVIVLRDIPREQAKEEIRQLFKTGRTLYYSDIVKNLGIGLRTVVEICDELKENGEIAVDETI